MTWANLKILVGGLVLVTTLSAHPLVDALMGIAPPALTPTTAPQSKVLSAKQCFKKLTGMARQIQKNPTALASVPPAQKTLIQGTLNFDLSEDDLLEMLRLPESARFSLSKPERGAIGLKALVGEKSSAELQLKRVGDMLEVFLDVHGELAQSFRTTPPLTSFTLLTMDQKPVKVSVNCTLGDTPKVFRELKIDGERAEELASKILMRNIKAADLQHLLPSLLDLQVRVGVNRSTSSESIYLTFEHSGFGYGMYKQPVATFLIQVEDGVAVAEWGHFEFANWTGPAERAVLFHDLMRALKKLCVVAVRLEAPGSDVTYNPLAHGNGVSDAEIAFAEWGGTVQLSEKYLEYLHTFPGAKEAGVTDLASFMRLPGAKEWWKLNGDRVPLRFILSGRPSVSFATLDEHLKSVGVASEQDFENVRQTLSRGVSGDLPEGAPPPRRAHLPVENLNHHTGPQTQSSPAGS